MNRLADILHAPFGLLMWGTSPLARYCFIVLVGGLSAVGALWLFKRLSRQARLVRLRKRIWGAILQLHLYPDRLGIIAGSLASAAADTVRSLGETILPLAVISIPVMAVMVEVNSRCGYDPLTVGGAFTIQAHVADGTALDSVTIETSPDIVLETAALRIPDESLVLWRARIAGDYEQTAGFVRITTGDGTSVEKLVARTSRPRRFEPRTVAPSFPAGLIHNADGFLPSGGPVTAVEVSYRRAEYRFFGWHVDAVVLYVMVTLIAGMILKPAMKVAL